MVSTKKRIGAKIIFNLVNSIIQIKIIPQLVTKIHDHPKSNPNLSIRL